MSIRLVRRAPRGPFGTEPGTPGDPTRGPRGYRRRRASRRGVHRRPLHRRPQAAGARQPGRPHLGAGPRHGRSAAIGPRDPRSAPRPSATTGATRRRVAHGGQRARLGVSGGAGRGLGGGGAARRRRGRASRARADGDRPVRPWGEPQAPPPPLLARPRRTARSGIAVGVMDRSRRPARCLRAGARRRRARWARSTRWRPLPSPTATTPRRWLGSCGGRRSSRSRRSALGCSWAPRARRDGPGEPACRSGPARRVRATSFAILRSRCACGTSWATSMSHPSGRSRETPEAGPGDGVPKGVPCGRGGTHLLSRE